MSAPRLRLTLPAGPLTMTDARTSLLGALWMWSRGGEVATSNENATALDDLEWLGIEPDAMVSAPKEARYLAAAETLVEAGAAYHCYCTSAQYREMQAAPDGPEPIIYDGRCRKLNPGELAALEKANRKKRVRLAVPADKPALPEGWADLPWPEVDHVLLEVDKAPSPAFAAAVDGAVAKATAALYDSDTRAWQLERALVDLALGNPLPELLAIPAWRGAMDSIAELREAGHHPDALLAALIEGLWSPDEPLVGGDLEDGAESFDPSDVAPEAPEIDDDALRAITGRTLAAMDDARLLEALVTHLSRRGYNVGDFDREWQSRFTAAARPTLTTLADAEILAGVLTAPTVDYTPRVTRLLHRPGVAEILDWFDAALAQVEDGDTAGWRAAIQAYRVEAESPGRALSTLRVVLTGSREGPPLAPVLALLGHERCRERLDKARRHLP